MKDIISVSVGDMYLKFDHAVVEAVQKCGINVNKEELIKALELAESLVRCKDCKWLGVQNEPEGTCYYWCRNIGVGFAVDEWNYCCWGERKDNE